MSPDDQAMVRSASQSELRRSVASIDDEEDYYNTASDNDSEDYVVGKTFFIFFQNPYKKTFQVSSFPELMTLMV